MNTQMIKLPHRLVYLIAILIVLSVEAKAIDLGPFSIRGFTLGQLNWATNQCDECQRFPDEDRQRVWADEILPDKEYKPKSTVFSLFQPYLELRPIYLGKGFQVSALLSQRWRDGMIDLPGIWYEKNVKIQQEYYGAVTIGAFPSSRLERSRLPLWFQHWFSRCLGLQWFRLWIISKRNQIHCSNIRFFQRSILLGNFT